MKINDAGLLLIKSFEGCRLTAYKAVATEKYYTIGYGHYGSDVKQGARITQAQADEYLRKDLAKFEKAVADLGRDFNENEFSALVSFAYNCGAANLRKLCTGRTTPEIAAKMLEYNKAGGKVLAGLVRRRKAEYTLFTTPCVMAVYQPPISVLKLGSKGSGVKWLQQALTAKGFVVAVDGVFGNETEKAVKSFQRKVFIDGVVGEATRKELLK